MGANKNKDFLSEIINDLLGDDKTAQVSKPKAAADETVRVNSESVSESLNFEKKVKTSVGSRLPVRPTPSGRGASSDAALVQSENLRIAQNRIFELEQETERLRAENEQLAAAGETIRKRSDELFADNEFKTKKLDEIKERLESEKEIWEQTLKAKDRELEELRSKSEEYEMRLSSNLQKIRVRERELENRLELVKMESSAVVRNKDEVLLELKRQKDQLSNELENFRIKGQELNRQLSEKQETLKRTVKALRLALNMLEGQSMDEPHLKKVK